MSTIRPFRAIRYATQISPDLSNRLSPPYDILDAADRDRLLRRDDRNFVKIDLPHVPPKSAGPPEAYQASQRTLAAWLADGTMVRDEKPAIYVYHQKYRHAGRAYVRKMFFAALRLEPFGTGSVFPHERTFGGPKEDRLALTKATRANLSPIFGLYEDPANEVSRRLEAALPPAPLATGRLDDVENILWGVSDPAVISAAVELMSSRPIYIADGHHRYGTGLLYRDFLIEQGGPLPPEHPANYVLCVFCAMEDPGLLILPTHRVLPGVSVSLETLGVDGQLDIRPLDVADAAKALDELPALGRQALAMYSAADDRCYAIRPKDPHILDRYEPQRSAAWRGLALALLHAYLLDRIVTPKLCGGREPSVQYIKAADEAVAAARQSRGTAFLTQPVSMEEMRAVCRSGDLMPQKSTYFYPKLASGLVIHPLEP